jgi:uncharacterized membrane protein YedE/YeeE
MHANPTARIVAALLCGILFGLGLAVAQMTDPAKVLAFFDVAAIPDGGWDPSLALVLGGAVAVTLIGFRLIPRPGRHPVLDSEFHLPTKTAIDAPLVLGSAIYGIGWGLVGFCVGPSVAALGYGDIRVLVFVVAMAAGIFAAGRIGGLAGRPSPDAPAKPAA